jgi:hypothetical protein
MVPTMYMNRICMQAMRQLNVHPRGFFFFSLGGGRRMNFFKFLRFHHVTSMSSYFPKVLNVFLKDPSKNTSLYPISFAQISFPLLTYI